jgi:zinc protease
MRSAAAYLLVSLVIVSPVLAQSPPLRVPYTSDTLANGLVLLVHEDHSVPIVSVNTLRRVGSGDEKPGRTGFAHLYEHLMFMGSEHAPYPVFDRYLEAAGADNNAFTTEDITDYYENGPSNALPLMVWLEADRTGWFLSTMDSAKVNLQRDVVKNERRQGVENQPYGLADETLLQSLYPRGHPYSWPVIGSMADLSAASVQDVRQFFQRFYAPNNTTLVVAGDVNPTEVRRLVRGYFDQIPRGPTIARPDAPAFKLRQDKATVLQDRVQLPRLYYMWHTVKRGHRDEAPLQLLAYILSGAKNTRLVKPLVYQEQLATEVNSDQSSKRLDGHFTIIASGRPNEGLPKIQQIVDRELRRLIASGPSARELQQAKNSTEARFLSNLETVAGKAESLNSYLYDFGEADAFQLELDRLRAVSASDVRRVARAYLGAHKVVLSIVPIGGTALAAKASGSR